MSQNTTKDLAYKAIDPAGKVAFSSDDMFECLKVIKTKPPGWRLVRTADSVLIAYTTGYKANGGHFSES